MLIPEFWAESRARHRSKNRQITVRRFGWSDTSQADAQAMADRRVQESLQRLIAGETLTRREPKVPYGGADGLPIREEVVRRAGPDVLTRNSYGALCLNSPDVLFIDIDFPTGPPLKFYAIYLAITLGIPALFTILVEPKPALIIAAVAMVVLGAWICDLIFSAWLKLQGGPERVMQRRIERFLQNRPDWHFRIYRTPAGIRAIAMHRTFLADDPEVAKCFDALGADRQYARMCRLQKCFRARVSPKPWRIGMTRHIRPGRGAWPAPPEVQPQRQAWIDDYESRSKAYAACRFMEAAGSMSTTTRTNTVCRLHDEFSRAESGLPIA
ncbi:hypothetical protein GC170_11235 [bacterium]|nr:hypothetical protein [bacterium]